MSPVDFVSERTCAECGATLDTLDWKPFCSETCWDGFEHSLVGGVPEALPVPADSTQEFRVLVFAPAGLEAPVSPLSFRIVDASGESAAAQDHFKAR